MVRILQLRDVDFDSQAQRLADSLAQGLGDGYSVSVMTVGRGGDIKPGLAQRLRSIPWPEHEVVHAIGTESLDVAVRSPCGRVVYTPVEFPKAQGRNSARWMRAAGEQRDIEIACTTAVQRRAFIERGVPPHHAHVIQPAVEFAKIQSRRDDKLRKSLGFLPTDVVMLACGESTRESRHDLATWATAILHVIDKKYKVLLWGRGPHSSYARRFAANMLGLRLYAIAEDQLCRPVEWDELFAAADVILVTSTGPVSTWPIAAAMASGLPIVSTVNETTAEVLEDRHSAAMVTKPEPRPIARRILDVLEDRGLQWSIADKAKTEAFEFFSPSRMLRQYRDLFSQFAAGQPVVVPAEGPGAGSRFHGRA